MQPAPLRHGVPGMESVVVSVAGYKGPIRNDIRELIEAAGATFNQNFTKKTTHLICYRAESEVYAKAGWCTPSCTQVELPGLKAACFQKSFSSLKLKYDKPLSMFAFIFNCLRSNLRPYATALLFKLEGQMLEIVNHRWIEDSVKNWRGGAG